jgi:RsiW-degrading membrane proteinase PrsW (M82 family)
MNITNNIFILIFALLPIIFYVYLVYFMIPKTYVSLDRARRYLISGLMSPFLIFLVYFLLPNWANPIGKNEILNIAFFSIVQIGILEELSKYIIFQWVSSERLSQKNDLPIATLYYSLMVALGFALTENISYLITLYQSKSFDPMISQVQLNNSMLEMAFNRSFTAVVMHMICGITMGYFLSIYNEKNKKNKIENDHLKYIIFGVLIASLYHGIYDLNLMLPENNYKLFFTAIIVIFGTIISYFMISKLINDSKIKRLCKMN